MVNIIVYVEICQIFLACPVLIKHFILCLQITAGVGNVQLSEGKGDYDDFPPPPPPELIQQQYLYGNAPQQGVYAHVAAPSGGQVPQFRPGAGETQLPKAQQAGVTVIPVSSKPIQVEKR